MKSPPRRVAVVGSGITGLSAAWLLHRSGAEVTLFEAEQQCGGHTLTDTSSPWPVDLGFQVFNLTTYPNLVGFLDALGVDSEPSDMSFALSLDAGRLEWGSVGDLDTVFAQRSNLVSPMFLRMVWDVVRFGKQAPEVLEPSQAHVYGAMTLGEYLDVRGYSAGFRSNYVLPMCAAVWSVPTSQVMDFPVVMLVRFWVNHHLLDLTQRPCWRVVKGRSRSYVEKVLAELPDVRTSTPVARVTHAAGPGAPVTVTTSAGDSFEYDAVVLATHSDISLAMLGDNATEAERAVLGAVPYAANDVYLHTDDSLMPRNRKTWSSWNFLGITGAGSDDTAVCVTYWLNKLQNLPPSAPQMFVTLNPLQPPAEEKTLRRLALAHPVYSQASYLAQQRLPAVQGTGGVYFAGAWAGYGFHEDGLRAGIEAATLLGAQVPWTPIATSPKMGLSDMVFLALFDKFARMAIKFGRLRLILPNGEERLYGSGEGIEAPVPKGEEWRGLPRRAATLRVLRMAMFRKIVTRHDVGMGEAYMDGDYFADDLGSLLAVVVANARALEGSRSSLGPLNWLGERLLHLAHLARSNTREGSRRNIEEHYDAGNAMYTTFLDASMTYSCGIHAPGGSLQDAQLAKLDAVIEAAALTPSDHVLEIGCGWGSFAIRAASKAGCRVTGLTLSKEQLAMATQRVQEAGLEDLVTLLLCDYRDAPGAGTYDKVVSIEMIEAVGHEHLRSYFSQIGRMLKPGGRAVIQVITQPDERYEEYCRSSDFIREHIFPGGHLPSMGSMVEAASGTGLSVRCVRDIGPDYAITLREWRKGWEANKQQVLSLGYSERFWLKFNFYFAYCEAAFDHRYIHDYHVTWVKDAGAALTDATTLAAPAAGAAAAVGASSAGAVVAQELPSDPITQVLLAIYFFLAGLLVHRHAYMWLIPLTSTLFALLHGAVHVAWRIAAPFYALMDPPRQAWWRADVAHAAYSAAAAAGAAALLATQPGVLVLQSVGEGTPPPALASVLACASTGFFALHLWVLVKHRQPRRGLGSICLYTTLLVLFAVASYRSIQVGLLAALLITEASSALLLAGRLMDACGAGTTRPRMRATLRSAERVGFAVLRLLPHLAVTAYVLLTPSAFTHPAYYALAMAGLLVCHYGNYRTACKVYARGAPAAPAVGAPSKLHSM